MQSLFLTPQPLPAPILPLAPDPYMVWLEFRRTTYVRLVTELLRAAPTRADLGPEWYEGNLTLGHMWRDVPGEYITMRRADGQPYQNLLREVLCPVYEPELSGRDTTVYLHPPQLIDYLDCLGGGPPVEQERRRLFSMYRDYQGPGGAMILRPPGTLGWQ